jgi:stress response protein SCP2
LGLGWDTNCDLDSSIILLNSEGLLIDKAYYGQLKTADGSVTHTGDNLTG